MEINLFDTNFTFFESQITALIGANRSGKNQLIRFIYDSINSEKTILDKKNSNQKEKLGTKEEVFYLKEDSETMLFNINIKEDIKFYLSEYIEEALYELLKSFNLDINILEKNCLELSSSELRKILLIIGLLSNSKVIIFENPTLKLDNKSIQTFIKNLKKLKRQDKIIIISSYNTNFLLEISDKIIVLHNNKKIKEGSKFDILSNEKLLNKINLKTPDIIKFVNKVKDIKNIKIGYRDNINDLIKDINRYAK